MIDIGQTDSQRTRPPRLLHGRDDSGQATSLMEIVVVMLILGILATMSTLTGKLLYERSLDSKARADIEESLFLALSVYARPRTGGQTCFGGADCDALDDEAMVRALSRKAEGRLSFAVWDAWQDEAPPPVGVVHVSVVSVRTTASHNECRAADRCNRMVPGSNGILGNPAEGDWIRLAVRSASGATFCAVHVEHTADPRFEGTGYQSHASTDYAPNYRASCGGNNPDPDPDRKDRKRRVSLQSCVWTPEGIDTVTIAKGISTNNFMGQLYGVSRGLQAADRPAQSCTTKPDLLRPDDFTAFDKEDRS